MKQLQSGLTRKIHLNKYSRKTVKGKKTKYLEDLIDPSFKRTDRIFILSFENKTDREVRTGCYLPKREVKDYMIDGMINGGNFFDQQINNDPLRGVSNNIHATKKNNI